MLLCLMGLLLLAAPFKGTARQLTRNAPGNRVEDLRSGTAFFVSADGFLVTSAHVVAGCPGITLWPANGPERTGRVVAIDAALDMALLSATGGVLLYEAGSRPNHARYPGETLSTIGFGSLPSQPRQPKVTNGRLVGSVFDAAGNPILLIRARLPEGNSGGPVIDANGVLLGMVTGRDAGQPELGVAIPAEAIDSFLGGRGISRTPSIPSGSPPTNTADLLKAIAVLVQCAPGRGMTAAVPQRF
jgi:serine protease Do